jgi:hypothetical protein
VKAAKSHDCLFDSVTKSWYVDITDESTLTPWHKARLTPPPTHELRVAYEERQVAKEHGARWDPELKSWVVRSRAPLDKWLEKRVKAPGGGGKAAPEPPGCGVDPG